MAAIAALLNFKSARKLTTLYWFYNQFLVIPLCPDAGMKPSLGHMTLNPWGTDHHKTRVTLTPIILMAKIKFGQNPFFSFGKVEMLKIYA